MDITVLASNVTYSMKCHYVNRLQIWVIKFKVHNEKSSRIDGSITIYTSTLSINRRPTQRNGPISLRGERNVVYVTGIFASIGKSYIHRATVRLCGLRIQIIRVAL